jgi:hypothetical protein
MDRALLTVLLVLVILLAAYGLLVGWRHRAARQSDLPELPVAPDDPGLELAEPLTGLYVSTTAAGRWQDRIVARGLGRRAAASVHLYATGIEIDRTGESALFLPAADVRAVGTAPGIAGKVMGMPDGILVITWELGGTGLDSGIRINDLEAQAEWLTAAEQLFPGRAVDDIDNDGARA